MEVEVLGVTGVPKDAIISIRAGASRRQAPVSSLTSTPFKFSGGPAGVNPFKVDVMQPLGGTRLAIKPEGGNFAVPIKGADGVMVNLSVREAKSDLTSDLFDRLDTNKDGVVTRREFYDAMKAEGDKPVLQPIDWGGEPVPIVSPDGKTLPALPKAEDARFPRAANDAKEYLEAHKLLPFVRAMLQTVVRDRPTDPYNFIAEQFRSAGPIRPEVGVQADESEVGDLETAKQRARNALGKSLLGQPSSQDAAKQGATGAVAEAQAKELKVAADVAAAASVEKDKKIEEQEREIAALRRSLEESRSSGQPLSGSAEGRMPGGVATVAPEPSAQDELAKALIEEASGPQESSRDDAEMLKVEKQKASLSLTREELGKMNAALKSEISELSEWTDRLRAERDSLQSKMTGSQ